MMQESSYVLNKINPEPQIYVVCQRAYNQGEHHGKWISAYQDYDDLMAEIKQMLADSPANKEDYPCEEWAIHDYENFCGYEVDEHENLKELVVIAEGIFDHGSAYAAFLEFYNIADDFDAYHEGSYSSKAEFGELYAGRNGLLTILEEHQVVNYFDFEKYGDALLVDYSYHHLNNEWHVFFN